MIPWVQVVAISTIKCQTVAECRVALYISALINQSRLPVQSNQSVQRHIDN